MGYHPNGGFNRNSVSNMINRIIKYVLISFTALLLTQPSVYSEICSYQTIKSSEESLPRIFGERIYLQTDREIYIAGDNMFFKVYLYDEGIKKLSDKSKIAYIIICNSNAKQIIHRCLTLSGGMGCGYLTLPDTLKTGPYQIIAYTNWMRNFGESTFFSKLVVIANRFDEELSSASPKIKIEKESGKNPAKSNLLTISTERRSYLQREQVNLKLSLSINSGANVSIAVAEKPPEKYKNRTLEETISSGTEFISHSKASRQNYRKICEYLVEDKGFIISGSVQNNNSPSDIVVVLSTPDTLANLDYSITNAAGRFYFQLDDFYYNKDLYISVLFQSKESESTLVIDDKYTFSSTYLLPEPFLSDQLKLFIKKSQTIASINRTYKIQSVMNEDEPPDKAIRRNVYYEPDYRVLLADYVPLKNFAEITREILPYIRLRKYDGTSEVEIIDSENKIFLDNPAIFLNGMLVNNINYILSFGSDKIRRIETIGHKRIFGSLEFNGILSVFTSPDIYNAIFFNQHSLHLPPITLLKRSYFIIPEYSTYEKIASRNPDFRQLLYWNPSIEIKANQPVPIEFYTSDNKGSYEINVEGITSDGTPLSCKAYFNVR
jgi:hypothetical protein